MDETEDKTQMGIGQSSSFSIDFIFVIGGIETLLIVPLSGVTGRRLSEALKSDNPWQSLLDDDKIVFMFPYVEQYEDDLTEDALGMIAGSPLKSVSMSANKGDTSLLTRLPRPTIEQLMDVLGV